jgi:NAD(P)-dependent dehydrogenase (short-subunit alcohol dehydrogenase family)
MANTRSVLVTGASSGIGRAIALDLAAAGMQVFGTVRSQKDAQALASATLPIIPVQMDVRDFDSVRAAAATVAAQTDGQLWGLVNNAGISVASPLEYLPIEAFEEQMDINVTGVLRCVQAFLPLLKPTRGRIVNISSMSGRIGFPMVGAYIASKHALEGLSDSLRMEMKVFGIEVSVIQPGSIETPIWQRSQARAAKLLAAMPADGHRDYKAMLQEAQNSAESGGSGGTQPQACADVVRHALTAKRPRTRYQVGKDAKRALFFKRWLLSDRRLDKVMLRSMGLS